METDPLIIDVITEFSRHRKLAEEAMSQLDDSVFFSRPADVVNPIALIVKHVAGNLRSRWTNFLTTDGDKPDRNRDGEFLLCEDDTREHLMEAWGAGWNAVMQTLKSLTNSDLDRTVTIRGEAHSVRQAMLRSVTHTAYHVGQILYVARLLKPDSKWLTIPPGQSQAWAGAYRQSAEGR